MKISELDSKCPRCGFEGPTVIFGSDGYCRSCKAAASWMTPSALKRRRVLDPRRRKVRLTGIPFESLGTKRERCSP